jgi:L1 cell adhesion molecule like protein
MSNKSPSIGIDLGTTFSCIGVWQNGKVEIIPNEMGERITPSYVSFLGYDKYIGEGGKSLVVKNPENTIFDSKRLIGRNFSDPIVQKDMKSWPFKIKEDHKNRPKIVVNYQDRIQEFFPEQISAMILSKLKTYASEFLGGKKIKDVVITVPAYFNDSQRQSTIDAGNIAGLNVIRIINEPTAAALAYGLEKKIDKEKNIIVFDLGGGTFDVSLLTLEDGIFEVKNTNGDTHLGGEDFDILLTEYCCEEFKKKYNLDLHTNKKSYRRLKTACEVAKKILSTTLQVNIDIDALMNGKDLNLNISRTKFENLCKDLFNKCIDIVKKVLKESNTKKNEIEDIILIGGSSRIPKIIEMISDFFDGKKPNQSINPDEAVAYGATVQAAIIKKEKDEKLDNVILMDITPLSLGIEIIGDKMDVIIPKNSNIPIQKEKQYTTVKDNQKNICIQIFEGENESITKNHKLGKFKLIDIPPMPKGVPSIIVKFDIDVNSILNVTAVEQSSGKSNNITIINDKGNLNTTEIEQFKNDNNIEEKKGILESTRLQKNLRKNMKYYSDQINKTNDNKLKVSLSKNLSVEIEEYIKEIDYNLVKTNEALLEKYIKYVIYLFQTFLIILKNNKENEETIKNKIYSYIDNIAKIKIKRIYELISIFKDIQEFYFILLLKTMRYYFNQGIKLFEEKKYIKSKNYFKEVDSFGNIFKQSLNQLEPAIKNEFEDLMESNNFHLQRIITQQFIEQGDDLYEKGIFDSENIDMDLIYTSLDKYREALGIIQGKTNKIDIEFEAICLSKIVKILFKILKTKNNDDIYQMGMQSVNLALSLMPKNVSSQKWYIEVTEIVQELRQSKDSIESKTEQQMLEELKKNKPEIFKEIDNAFEAGELNFIKFCLSKYPYPNYTDGQNIEENYNKNAKSYLRKLIAKYHPDRLDKNTKEEMEKYLIITELVKKLNNLFMRYK